MYLTSVNNLTNDEKKFQLGVEETLFKARFCNHTQDFKHPKYKKTLSYQNIYWNSKMVIYHQLINGVLLKHNSSFRLKFYLIKSLNNPNLLNKKSE